MANTLQFSATHCPAKETLLAFSSGRLPETELGTIGLHLQECETCLAFLDSQAAAIGQESSQSTLLDDTAFERIKGEAEFQRMKANAKAMAMKGAETGATATWTPPSDCLELTADELPEKIGRYFVLKKLGRGGFAIVYLARDPERNRLVAVKVPRADKFENQGQVDDFLREARTAATLDHPHIVPVFDFDRLPNGSCFVVMQYIEGRSLEDAMACEKFTSEQAAGLCAKIASALEYAHQRKFVHRDIKPANILLDKANQPYIADFGLAIHEQNQGDRRGEFAGTLRYMSPEQVQGRVHHLDGRTDVWSLGVMLYELLTRARPFPGKTGAELEDEIRSRAPKSPRSVNREIPEDLEGIVMRCLEKQVEARSPSAAEVAGSLEAWLQSRLPRPRRRLGLAAAAVAAVVLVATLLAVVVFAFPSWFGGGGENASTEHAGPTPKNEALAPTTTVPKPKTEISLLESEPIMVFGHPGPDPIFEKFKEYSVGPTTGRWIAKTYQCPTQRVRLQGTVSLKDWVGTIGFAWQVRDIHELGSENIQWMTVEVYRHNDLEPLMIMVRKIVVGEDVAGNLLKATRVQTPTSPTTKLELVIERSTLSVMFGDQPAIELTAANTQVSNWMEEGELTIALTGEGRRVTFKDVQLELSSTSKK